MSVNNTYSKYIQALADTQESRQVMSGKDESKNEKGESSQVSSSSSLTGEQSKQVVEHSSTEEINFAKLCTHFTFVNLTGCPNLTDVAIKRFAGRCTSLSSVDFTDHFRKIPAEIISNILFLISYEDEHAAILVNKEWNQVISDNRTLRILRCYLTYLT